MDESIEASLERHLTETQSALQEIEECLEDNDEADKTDLMKLKLELEVSAKETEAALLQIKKDRILEEVKVRFLTAIIYRMNCVCVFSLGGRRDQQ